MMPLLMQWERPNRLAGHKRAARRSSVDAIRREVLDEIHADYFAGRITKEQRVDAEVGVFVDMGLSLILECN